VRPWRCRHLNAGPGRVAIVRTQYIYHEHVHLFTYDLFAEKWVTQPCHGDMGGAVLFCGVEQSGCRHAGRTARPGWVSSWSGVASSSTRTFTLLGFGPWWGRIHAGTSAGAPLWAWACCSFWDGASRVGPISRSTTSRQASVPLYLRLSHTARLYAVVFARFGAAQLHPEQPFLGIPPVTVPESHILCSGFWGLSRHINYLGEIVQVLGLQRMEPGCLGHPAGPASHQVNGGVRRPWRWRCLVHWQLGAGCHGSTRSTMSPCSSRGSLRYVQPRVLAAALLWPGPTAAVFGRTTACAN
jgi:hypothetical protein